MSSDLLGEGVQLMLAGMGAVFVFLTLLVLGTMLMSRLVLRFQPITAVTIPNEVVRKEVVGEQGAVSDEEVAAISIAITRYRQSIR